MFPGYAVTNWYFNYIKWFLLVVGKISMSTMMPCASSYMPTTPACYTPVQSHSSYSLRLHVHSLMLHLAIHDFAVMLTALNLQ